MLLPSQVQIGESVIFQKLKDEAILLNMETQHYFGLNGVATRMWELMLESGETGLVVEKIAEGYSADPETVRTDLTKLVAGLVDAGLLKAS